MKAFTQYLSSTTACCLAGIVLVSPWSVRAADASPDAAPGIPLSSINWRYAYSCDGHNQDRDDVAGSAMVIAIFDRAGRATNLVHYYVNTSGRNDITKAKVARDPANVYFYVMTRQPLTPRTDPNWMWLLIDADLNPKTGWGGYDFILNRTMDGPTTWLEKNTGGWRWEKLAKIEVVTIGNELMLAVPRQALDLPPSDVVQLDFKWWDHAQKPGDIMDTYLSGDCAPEARFNYRFTTVTRKKGATE